MRRCSHCVEPSSAPNIHFDDQNVCNYCKTYSKFKYKGEEKLLKLLDSKRRTDSKYDCLVSISGGRDSTYVLLKLVKDTKMKVLAYNYANPFTDPQAKKNIQNAIDILGVNLVTVEDKNHVHEMIFRDNIYTWFKNPNPALIPLLCVRCKSLLWDALRIARENDIHCIVTGGNPFEDTAFKKELLSVSRDETHEGTFIRTTFGLLKDMIQNPYYFNRRSLPAMVKGYLFADEGCFGPRILGYNIDWVRMFEYIEWNEEEILRRIQSELHWDYPRKFKSTWRFDCRIGHLKDFLYMKTIGMTERDDFYSKMIREGIISREEALERLKNENQIYLDEIIQLLEQVGIMDHSFIFKLDEWSDKKQTA